MEIKPEVLRICHGPAVQVLGGGEVLGEFAVDVGAVDVHGDFVRGDGWMPDWLELALNGVLHFVCCVEYALWLRYCKERKDAVQ